MLCCSLFSYWLLSGTSKYHYYPPLNSTCRMVQEVMLFCYEVTVHPVSLPHICIFSALPSNTNLLAIRNVLFSGETKGAIIICMVIYHRLSFLLLLMYSSYRVSVPRLKQPGRGAHRLPPAAPGSSMVKLFLYLPFVPPLPR